MSKLPMSGATPPTPAPFKVLPPWLADFLAHCLTVKTDERLRIIAQLKQYLTAEKIAELKTYHDAIAIGETQIASNGFAVEAATLIVRLASVFGPRDLSDADRDAWGEAFGEAIDDIPVWAVREALRCWHRGDAGRGADDQPYSYRFAPKPAELRRIAAGVAAKEHWHMGIVAQLLEQQR